MHHAPPPSCAFCSDEACTGIICQRCGNRLCLAHVPLPERHCDACEYSYMTRRDEQAARLWFWVPFTAVWLFFVITAVDSLSARILIAVVMTGFTAVFAGKAGLGLYLDSERRRFLAERDASPSRPGSLRPARPGWPWRRADHARGSAQPLGRGASPD